MKFTTALSALALAATAVESSSVLGCHRGCISQSQANTFITRFSNVLTHTDSDLGNFTQTAELLLANNFQEISGSINSLAGFPLDAITTPTKEDYISALTHGPADAGINTIFTAVAACHNVVWHWEFDQTGSGQYPVKGFNYFKFNRHCQVEQLQLEFNSIAWGLDIGFGLVLPNGTTIGGPSATTGGATSSSSAAATTSATASAAPTN